MFKDVQFFFVMSKNKNKKAIFDKKASYFACIVEIYLILF